MIKALIWKEWRECRTFVIVVIMLMLLVRIVWPYLPYIFPDVRSDDLKFFKYFIGGAIFPLCLLSIIFFSSFYYELKNNTVPFLLIKPVSTAKIFWVKYFFCLSIFFSMTLSSFGIFDVYSCDFFSQSSQNIFSVLLAFLCISTFSFTCQLFYRIKGRDNLLLSLLGLFSLFVSIPHLTASVIFITFDIGKMFIVLLAIFTAISLLTGFVLWQKKVSKDASPVVLLAIISITLSIFSVLFFLTLNIYAGWKLDMITHKAEIAGLKISTEDLNKLTDEEKKSDELYQKAFAIERKIYTKYKCCCPEHFAEKNENHQQELLFIDPDYTELSNITDEIIAMPHRRLSISFDEYELPIESRELSKIACIFERHIEAMLNENRYDEAIASIQKICKLFYGVPDISASNIHSKLSSDENRLLGIVLKVPSDVKYIEPFRYFLSRLDKTSKDLPGQMIKDSVSDYYGRINKYLTGKYQRGLLFGTNKKIIEYLLIDYFGRPCIRKNLYENLESSIRQSSLFREEDTLEILKAMSEEDQRYQFIFLYFFRNEFCLSIAKAKIYVDLNRQALALKIYKAEHGAYPEKLEEIVKGIMPKLPIDYFSKKNFVYRRNGEGFILYSVGANRRDDGGEVSKGYSKNYTREKDDITCVCEN